MLFHNQYSFVKLQSAGVIYRTKQFIYNFVYEPFKTGIKYCTCHKDSQANMKTFLLKMVYVCLSQLTLHHNDNCSVYAIHKLYIKLIHNHVANVQKFENEDIIKFNSQKISNYKLFRMQN